MGDPKQHHFVPRFYLSGFNNPQGKVWVFDKLTDKIFQTTGENIAKQNQFYRIDELAEDGIDALELEKQLAGLEYETSNIINDWFRQWSFSEKLIIPDINREIISLYIVTQLLRTVEAREQLVQFSNLAIDNYDAYIDAKNLQAAILWDDAFISQMKKRISDCIWIFGKNESESPFWTSDHPVLVKTQDNKQWLLGPRIFDEGMYVVFPLSPTMIMYCKDPEYWKIVKMIENSISPVKFTDDTVQHENSGQVGMSNRFIFSSESNFAFAEDFLIKNKHFKDPQRGRF
jgi:hypothetical protein